MVACNATTCNYLLPFGCKELHGKFHLEWFGPKTQDSAVHLLWTKLQEWEEWLENTGCLNSKYTSNAFLENPFWFGVLDVIIERYLFIGTHLRQEMLENESTINYVSGSIKALWVKKLRMCKEVAPTQHGSSQMAMKMTNAFNSYQLYSS